MSPLLSPCVTPSVAPGTAVSPRVPSGVPRCVPSCPCPAPHPRVPACPLTRGGVRRSAGTSRCRRRCCKTPPPAKKPAAHLIADATISSQANGSLRWDPTKAWAFLRGLGYQGGSLVCHQPGLYFVYAKVQLGAPRSAPAPARHPPRHPQADPRYPGVLDLLVNKVVYCPQSQGGPWARHSFLGGLVRLERGDEVFTRVQAPQLVRAVDGSRSYFGMFMV
ncbi:tumor necrosis factor ligand superfamily member 14-like [Falco naumanni]|uniref:tumor necrosis factor ligand superfamily member 14-like n=1 Tax=Falco naumanni TaxID=148594 RepID=UPI001ADE243D|nr:tumor necrosis factor ligand superfamily member 14-like [Falco naumanni]